MKDSAMSEQQPRTNRALYQSFGYWVKEPSIRNPQLAVDGVRELAKQRYDLVRVMLRDTNFTFRSPEYVAVIARMTEEAHRLGLKIALDCEPHTQVAGWDMGKEFPGGMGRRVHRAAGQLVDGRFVLHVKPPNGQLPMPRVEGAFVRKGSTVTKLPSLQCGVNYEQEFYDTGFAERYVEYTPGRAPIAPQHYFNFHGRLADHANGELIVYFSFEDNVLIDFWSDATRSYYASLVECYRDVPLDGFGWDEPAAEVGWDCYRWGDATAGAFIRLNGYDLRDRMYQLDEMQLTPEAVKVKLDYYRTLNEGVFQAQKHLCDLARAKCGAQAILGTHHTWVGEGGIADFRAGAVDYFRLNENMDAGYTDGVWWFDGCIDYIYALASSLGRMTPSGATEVNTWHWKPTIAAVEHAVRLMGLMRINWFNIWAGDASDTAKYPEHYTYDACNAAMLRLRKTLGHLEHCRPVVDVAIWHGWEGVMAMNTQEWAFGLKNSQLYGSEALARRCIAFDFVDSELLADARIDGEELVTRLERYKVLVMPYAIALPEKVWSVCKAFANAGGKVLFVGPPPVCTVEGRDVTAEFAALAGIRPMSFEQFSQSVGIRCTLRADGPHRWDVSVPVDMAGGRPLVNIEGEIRGACNQAGTFWYMTDLVPRGDLADLLEKLAPPAVACHSGSIEWRLYRQADGIRKLVLIATKHRRMRGIIRFAGTEIEIEDGLQAIITANKEGEIAIEGQDVKYQVRSKGK